MRPLVVLSYIFLSVLPKKKHSIKDKGFSAKILVKDEKEIRNLKYKGWDASILQITFYTGGADYFCLWTAYQTINQITAPPRISIIITGSRSTPIGTNSVPKTKKPVQAATWWSTGRICFWFL